MFRKVRQEKGSLKKNKSNPVKLLLERYLEMKYYQYLKNDEVVKEFVSRYCIVDDKQGYTRFKIKEDLPGKRVFQLLGRLQNIDNTFSINKDLSQELIKLKIENRELKLGAKAFEEESGRSVQEIQKQREIGELNELKLAAALEEIKILRNKKKEFMNNLMGVVRTFDPVAFPFELALRNDRNLVHEGNLEQYESVSFNLECKSSDKYHVPNWKNLKVKINGRVLIFRVDAEGKLTSFRVTASKLGSNELEVRYMEKSLTFRFNVVRKRVDSYSWKPIPHTITRSAVPPRVTNTSYQNNNYRTYPEPVYEIEVDDLTRLTEAHDVGTRIQVKARVVITNISSLRKPPPVIDQSSFEASLNDKSVPTETGDVGWDVELCLCLDQPGNHAFHLKYLAAHFRREVQCLAKVDPSQSKVYVQNVYEGAYQRGDPQLGKIGEEEDQNAVKKSEGVFIVLDLRDVSGAPINPLPSQSEYYVVVIVDGVEAPQRRKLEYDNNHKLYYLQKRFSFRKVKSEVTFALAEERALCLTLQFSSDSEIPKFIYHQPQPQKSSHVDVTKGKKKKKLTICICGKRIRNLKTVLAEELGEKGINAKVTYSNDAFSEEPDMYLHVCENLTLTPMPGTSANLKKKLRKLVERSRCRSCIYLHPVAETNVWKYENNNVKKIHINYPDFSSGVLFDKKGEEKNDFAVPYTLVNAMICTGNTMYKNLMNGLVACVSKVESYKKRNDML